MTNSPKQTTAETNVELEDRDLEKVRGGQKVSRDLKAGDKTVSGLDLGSSRIAEPKPKGMERVFDDE